MGINNVVCAEEISVIVSPQRIDTVVSEEGGGVSGGVQPAPPSGIKVAAKNFNCDSSKTATATAIDINPPIERREPVNGDAISQVMSNGTNINGASSHGERQSTDENETIKPVISNKTKTNGDKMAATVNQVAANGDNSLAAIRDNLPGNDTTECSSDGMTLNTPPGSPDDSLEGSIEFPQLPPVPQVDKPSALRLAKRLYNLEGFKKQDVSRQLSKKNDFSQLVAEAYFQEYDFTDLSLDLALRGFLSKCILVGETQERERVLMFFSQRFLESNPELLQTCFRSQDSLHTLTCALVLLNTDLHNLNVQMKRMGPKDFVENLTGLNEGLNFPYDMLYNLYTSIRNQPLDWGQDSSEQEQDSSDPSSPASGDSLQQPPESNLQLPSVADTVNLSGPQAGGINPFLALPDSNGVEYKRGYIVRKCCYDANGKKTGLGKRGWRMFYVTLRELVLFCFKDEKTCEQPGAFKNPQVALRLHSSLAHKAVDYQKRKHVFRLILADRAEFLFRTTNEEELDAWVTMINTVVSRYSSPPLPAGCSSNSRFQRPLYPSSCSQLSLQQQLKSHQTQLDEVEHQLDEETTADTKVQTVQSKQSNTTPPNHELVQFLLREKERYMVYILSLQNLVTTGNSTSSGPSGISSGTCGGTSSGGTSSGTSIGTSSGIDAGCASNSSEEGIKSNHQTTYLPVTTTQVDELNLGNSGALNT